MKFAFGLLLWLAGVLLFCGCKYALACFVYCCMSKAEKKFKKIATFLLRVIMVIISEMYV